MILLLTIVALACCSAMPLPVACSQFKKPPRMTPDEKRLARELHFDRHEKPAAIARLLGRDLSCICRLFAQKRLPKPVGRPAALSTTQIDNAVRVLESMIDDADATYEITVAMLKRRCRLKVCTKVLSNALHARGYWFSKLRKKQILTPDDVKARFAWAKKYQNKPCAWWLKTIHVHLDNKHFKVATTAGGRKQLAKCRVRGVYRTIGKSLRPGHVQPHPKLRLNTGAKGILKMGGVGDGKVLVWHTIQGEWSGAAAEEAYTTIVSPALQKHYGRKTTFNILEDNDPTGNRSKRGVQAKKDNKLKVFEIPKRSPDLNVLDYAVWSEVEKRMRRAERKMMTGKKETRAQFAHRLDRTAWNLPAAFVNRSIGDLHRRCKLLHAAKGGLFEEGGRRARRPL